MLGGRCIVLVLGLIPFVSGNDNGLALTPPLGWRSWNLYGGNPYQDKLEEIMNGMVARRRKDHLGNLVSLCDLGYCDVGLDDLWQDCHTTDAAPGMHYHDALGNPIVNLKRFPSLENMTKHATDLGLTAGWYANNCACSDHCRTASECDMQIRQDVKALLQYGFQSLKIDGCGNQTNLQLWNHYMQEYSSQPILVENCHGRDPKFKPNRTLPPAEGCPYNFYRTSVDIRNNYASIMHNLGTVEPFRATNSSYPGCWAYADMLQVGVRHGLNYYETRSHFGGWAIVSSPLTLSHDVNDDTVMDKVWDIISNREVLAVNQAYVGDSGGVYDSASTTVVLESASPLEKNSLSIEVPVYQYLSKPTGHEQTAVLLMNSGNASMELVATFADIPNLGCSDACHVRDLWNHKDFGIFRGNFSIVVDSHDAAFLLLSNPTTNILQLSEARRAAEVRTKL